jgi:hypothetical protein
MALDDSLKPHEMFLRWLRRAHFPDERWLPLGRAGELWSPQSDHPARAWLEERAAELGREIDVTYYLTRSLLDDVLHAAGGVEYSAYRVLEQLDAAQAQFEEQRHQSPETYAFNPHVPHHWVLAPTITWDYANLLTWLRAFADRICRREPSGGVLGLLPAIGDATAGGDIEECLRRYRSRVGGDRQLANYALHASQVPGGGSPSAEITASGALVMRIPDRSSRTIYVFDQFRFDQNRDLRTFAERARSATEELVEGILASLERANARFKAVREADAGLPAAPGGD